MNDPRDVSHRAAPRPDAIVSYGPHPDQVVDVRAPRGRTGAAPLVVLVHGGFWRVDYDRGHISAMAAALTEAGYAVCVPEYRRTGQEGGGWPGTLDDLAVVTDTLPGLIAGVAMVDESRMVLVGHSAGGHLALWAAARHRLDAESPWRRDSPLPARGVVALAPVSDLARCAEWNLDDGAVQAFLGGSPDDHPERYAVVDPAALVPLGVHAIVLHGTEDGTVPITMSRRFVARGEAAGDPIELHEVAGCEHFGLIDPESKFWPHVEQAIATMLD